MIKYLTASCLIMLFISCKKEDADFTTASINDYFPLQVGKTITYNLDSTIYYLNFGAKAVEVHYQAQYRVDAQSTDNLGRTVYNISRYLRSDSSQPWAIDNVFTAIPTKNSLEYIVDNLRFIKLMLPVKDGFSWKGNSYLPYDAYEPYNFANPAFTQDWDYIYQDVNKPLTIGNQSFDNTITVFEVADSTGNPDVPGTDYAEKTYSLEQYAKNVGLIYRDFIHWEYQSIDHSYKGFGERLSIIDHN